MTTANPKWLEDLQSRIFEGLPSPAKKKAWRKALDSAIPAGLPEEAFTRIRIRFLHDLLVQKVQPLVPHLVPQKKAISRVVDLFNRSINGEPISKDEWQQAATAARSAALAADTYAAAWAAAAAAESAKWAADHAAWAAAAAAETAAAAAETVADAAGWAACSAVVTPWYVSAYTSAAWAADAGAAAAAANFWVWAASHLLELIKQESAPQAAQTA